MLMVRHWLTLIFGGLSLVAVGIALVGVITMDRIATSHQQTLVNSFPLILRADQFTDATEQLVRKVIDLQYTSTEEERWERLFEINQQEQRVNHLFDQLFSGTGISAEFTPLQQTL
ncbi:MAG: hypothetical protein HN344_07385, partial [Gammaproteobacteria bacterium]|nr:hypothetical protein [Gammaproteobacteria bacterium]